jgi:hypothetical protein
MTKAVIIEDIKRQRARVNTGENVETDYQELRRLQKHFTNTLVAQKGKIIGLHWTTLRQLRPRDFPAGTIIRVGKYRVTCDGRYAKAYNSKTFRDLRSRDMPLYLKEFIGI